MKYYVRLIDQVRPMSAHGQHGIFGCPYCWTMSKQIITPADTSCPECGCRLEWTEEATKVAITHQEARDAQRRISSANPTTRQS